MGGQSFFSFLLINLIQGKQGRQIKRKASNDKGFRLIPKVVSLPAEAATKGKQRGVRLPTAEQNRPHHPTHRANCPLRAWNNSVEQVFRAREDRPATRSTPSTHSAEPHSTHVEHCRGTFRRAPMIGRTQHHRQSAPDLYSGCNVGCAAAPPLDPATLLRHRRSASPLIIESIADIQSIRCTAAIGIARTASSDKAVSTSPWPIGRT